MTTLYILKHRRGLLRRPLRKIGITSGAARLRSGQVAAGGMKNTVSFALPFLFGAARLEKFLHRRYARQNRAGRGSGKTEWFALSWFEAQWLKIELLLLWAAQWGAAMFGIYYFIFQPKVL